MSGLSKTEYMREYVKKNGREKINEDRRKLRKKRTKAYDTLEKIKEIIEDED